jgi:membrane protein
VFSLPALLVIALAIGASVFGEEATRGQVDRQIQDLIGNEGAAAIQAMLDSARRPDAGAGFAAWLGGLAFLFGSTNVFGQLQKALNAIWGVRPQVERGPLLRRLARKRLLSFGMVLGFGFLLLVSLLLSALLTAFADLVRSWFPEPALVTLIRVLDFGVSLAAITVLLAAIYTILPDTKVRWRYAWLGAAITAVLFVIGKFFIGLYLGKSAPGSAFGAAGSLVIVLIWVYYSSILMFCGAEFIQVISKRRGAEVLPEAYAKAVGKYRPQSETPRAPAPGLGHASRAVPLRHQPDAPS